MINVLVADDDHHLCSALRQLIDHEDDMRTVGVAHDGDEAVELALGMQPDVMLLDVQMPRLSGLEDASAAVQPPSHHHAYHV